MKKIIKIAILILISYIAIFVGGNNKSAAVKIEEEPTVLTINRRVKNADEEVTNTFKYTVVADESNPSDAEEIPTEAIVEFDSVKTDDSVANATGLIDFSKANFNDLGIYKYKVYEISSSNSVQYPIDSKNSYEIYIQVINRNGNKVAIMLGLTEHYIDNNDQNEKMEIEFESTSVPIKNDDNKSESDSKEEQTPEKNNIVKEIIKTITPKTGDTIFIYIVLTVLFIIIIIILLIFNRKGAKDENLDNNDKSKN